MGIGRNGRSRIHCHDLGRLVRRAVGRPANRDRTVATHSRDLRGCSGGLLPVVSSPNESSAATSVTGRTWAPSRQVTKANFPAASRSTRRAVGTYAVVAAAAIVVIGAVLTLVYRDPDGRRAVMTSAAIAF